MRKKLHEEEKRSKIIGIKVKPETKAKLKYIAKAEATQVSTLIDDILKDYVAKYFKKHGINWSALTPEEKEGRDEAAN